MKHESVGDLSAHQHGVVSLAQARELGMTMHQVKTCVVTGRWERLHREVFRIRGARITYSQCVVAGCLAIGPEAVASHRAAATLHGLLTYREPPVEVTTNRLRSPEVDGVVVHRLADLQERWVTVVDEVRVTTAARTLVDLGAVASPRTVEVALDRAAGRDACRRAEGEARRRDDTEASRSPNR
jgi:predicted transcriptional regulator of viral defense system